MPKLTHLAAGVVLAAIAAAAQSAPLQPCRLRGVEHEALCGSVQRALDPADAQGPKVDVHFAVLPALARNKKPDPVFFFAGGPGQSAIDLAGSVGALLGRFTNRRDIVLIDQRGTGRSAPLQCPEDDPARPLAELVDTQRQRDRLLQCFEQLKQAPHGDLRHYTTPVAMADADAVRATLGAEKINVIGGSYGSRAVLEYQRQFPQRVRRAVIDGVAPPDMAMPSTFSSDNQAALEAVFAACAADPGCSAREPQLATRWRALLASLPREVVLAHPVSGRREQLVLTRDALLSMVRAPLYVPALAAALPAALGEATRERFEPLASLAMAFGARRQTRLAEGMHFAVVCAEDYPRMAGAREPVGEDFGTSFVATYDAVCPRIARGAVPPAFYTMPAAPAAVLLLSGGADPVTPARHGERAARALGAKARHVVVAQAGHGVMGIGCMRDVLYRFVDASSDEEALAVDASCVATVPRPRPFAPIELKAGAR